ncbi:MAG: copper resistance protein CopC [Gemmatimonadota bacterium]
MKTRAHLVLFALLVAAIASRPGSAVEPFHLRLERSAPAEDSVVEPPTEIRLWFSQSTQENATTIRLIGEDGEPLSTGDLVTTDDRTVHHVPLSGPLAEGRYTVSWRTMAQDGHVVRGEFEFTVQTGAGDAER